MHRLILWWGIIYFFAFPKVALASVVLNEIYANPENEDEEFIELYNNSDAEVDLKDWKIADLIKSYTVTDLKIPPKSFLVLEKSLTSIALNNSNEAVTLTDNNGSSVDTFSYENTFESTSWSRVPDATGGFFNKTSVTKGTYNASPPTPTFTITPTPTKLPSPTKEPTATKSPTSTKVPTATVTVTKESIIEEKKTPLPSKRTVRSGVVDGPTKSVAGINDGREEKFENRKDLTPNYLYSFTTGIGMLILACGILLYKKFRHKNDEDKDDF